MKRLILSILAAAALWLIPHAHAQAACTVPNTFTPGTIAHSDQVNANNAALIVCINSLSAANIGPGGLWASNLIPTTVAQATFGGTGAGINYTFPAGLNLPAIGTGCMFVASDHTVHTTGQACQPLLVPIASGGTGADGSGYVAGQCFYFDGVGFATRTCSSGGITTLSAVAPVTVDNTDPANPIVGLQVPLATAFGGTGGTGASNMFAPTTADCVGGSFASGTGTMSWLPCLQTVSAWNGSSFDVSAQDNTPLVFVSVPFTITSCPAVATISDAPCVTVNVPIPSTPTAWGYSAYTFYACEVHEEDALAPMAFSASVVAPNIVIKVYNPYGFTITSGGTLSGVCQASAAHA